MTTQDTQSSQTQTNEEHAEKLRRVLSVADPAQKKPAVAPVPPPVR